jgi:hypothetical protein
MDKESACAGPRPLSQKGMPQEGGVHPLTRPQHCPQESCRFPSDFPEADLSQKEVDEVMAETARG